MWVRKRPEMAIQRNSQVVSLLHPPPKVRPPSEDHDSESDLGTGPTIPEENTIFALSVTL